VLTGRLVLDLLKQLPVALPAQLAARLQHPDTTSLAARRLLTESDTASSGGAVPETPGGFVPPGASLLRPLWHLASDWLGGIRLFRPGFAGQALAQAPAPAPAPDIEAELRGTLAAYREALERKDIDGLSAYYETLSPSQRGALMQYFANAEDLHIELSDVRVAIIGDAAAVSFTRQDHFIDRNTGAPQRVNVRITKRFSRGSSGWVIRNEP